MLYCNGLLYRKIKNIFLKIYCIIKSTKAYSEIEKKIMYVYNIIV